MALEHSDLDSAIQYARGPCMDAEEALRERAVAGDRGPDVPSASLIRHDPTDAGKHAMRGLLVSGLVVGVLAFVAYHWLNSRLDKLAHRMEETKMKFLDILNEPGA